MAKITSMPGIDGFFCGKLENMGVATVEALLHLGATRQGRKEIARQVEVGEELVLAWVHRAELFRIKGIGSRYAGLLEQVGVISVPELAQRKPVDLLMQMQEKNATHHLVKAMPYLKQVSKWIGRARDLPRVVYN